MDKLSKFFIVLAIFSTTAVAICPSGWWPGRLMNKILGYGIDYEDVQNSVDFFESNVPGSCESAKQPNGSYNCASCLTLKDRTDKFCVFDTTKMQCIDRPSTITTDIVTSNNAERCPTLQQISNLKPTQVEINTARTEWGQIKGHVLNGETGDPTSGRHLFSSWQVAHRGEQGICQRKTNLCSFLRTTKVHKTVWDDRARSADFPGRYSTDQVADICIGAIILHGRNKGSNPFSVSMQTASNGPTNGKSICITHRTGASCFPDGIHPTLNQLGTPCASTGDAVTTDTYNVTL